MAKKEETPLGAPEDVTQLQIQERFIREVQGRKINEINEQNTLLLALANQQNEEIRTLREALDAATAELANRQQRRAATRPAPKKGKAKK